MDAAPDTPKLRAKPMRARFPRQCLSVYVRLFRPEQEAALVKARSFRVYTKLADLHVHADSRGQSRGLLKIGRSLSHVWLQPG